MTPMIGDVTRMSDAGLYSMRRQLIRNEPKQPHNILNCGVPNCPQCAEWSIYARRLMKVNLEIERREGR